MSPMKHRETKTEQTTGYQLLSRYRSELMGIAMLWVMLFHAYEFHFGVGLLDAFKELGFGGVDMFILLSGLGLYGSLVRRRDEPLRKYFLRRCGRILPTYWLVVGLYSLWLRLQGRISLSVGLWSMSTLHYWFRIPGSFNWYVPAILALYLLAPFWVRLLERSCHKELWTALTYFLSYGLYRLSIPFHLNYMEDFLYRIPTFAVGLLAGYYVLSGKRFTAKHGFVWGLSALLGAFIMYGKLRGMFYINTCYVINTCVMAVCLLLAYGLHFAHWEWLHRPLRLLGECSLEIYLLNVIVTREFAVLSPLLDRGGQHVFYYVAVYCVNIVLAVLLHRGLDWARKQMKTIKKEKR